MTDVTEGSGGPAPAPDRPHMPASYGVDRALTGGVIAWDRVISQLTDARNYWIVTASLNGRPHAAPVWGVWHEGVLYFATDRTSRKGRNLAVNPALVVHLESGDDVVILEGDAVEATDIAAVEGASRRYAAKYDGFTLPAEAGGPNVTYTIRLRTAYAWVERDFPGSATRWLFNDPHAGP